MRKKKKTIVDVIYKTTWECNTVNTEPEDLIAN